MPRRKDEEVTETPKKRMGNDAVVTVEIRSDEGTINKTLHIKGFLGNTLGWQRSGKALDETLVNAFSSLGAVTVE